MAQLAASDEEASKEAIYKKDNESCAGIEGQLRGKRKCASQAWQLKIPLSRARQRSRSRAAVHPIVLPFSNKTRVKNTLKTDLVYKVKYHFKYVSIVLV
jgi:hypothetical protein